MRGSSVFGAVLIAATGVSSALTIASIQDVVPSSLDKRNLAQKIWKDIENLATCSSCEALLVVLKLLADSGDGDFVSVITEVCELAGIDDTDVCKGAIGLEGPILAHDLREMSLGSRTSNLFCLTVFGLCPWPEIEPYSVTMPPRPSASRPATSGQPLISVVHISDIHVDPSYETGASYNCTKPLCCRPYTAADQPGSTEYPAGPYGNHACDSPISLEESMYHAIQSIVPERAFTIFTGDVVEADVWLTTQTEVTDELSDGFVRMQSLGQAYAVVGNHDSNPVNSFPPPSADTSTSVQWAYNVLAAQWTNWIGSAAATEASSNFGSYSVLSPSGVRIISINTNFWYKQNFWLYKKTMDRDPAGQLAWLAAALQAAETAGERVWVIGHMPLGSGDAFHDQAAYFDQIVQRYDATIAALFFGHSHQDQFEISYSTPAAPSWQTATMVSYIAPALTPRSGYPSFRVYSVDPVTFAVLDYTTYFANYSDPTFQTNPTWEKLYSAKEVYGCPLGLTDPAAELTPAFWHNVTTLFESDNDAFQAWYARKVRDPTASACTGDCIANAICGLRAAQSQYNCGTVSPGINFRRSSIPIVTDTHNADTTCHGSGVVPMFRRIQLSHTGDE